MRSGQVPVQSGSAPVIPPAASVLRKGLLDQLDAATDARAICLSAPGGFGKSTLLAQWAARQQRRVIWLNVPVGTDAVALAERLAGELTTSMTTSTPPLPAVHDRALWFSVVLPSLEKLVRGQPEPYLLVLDDAMNVTDPTVDALMSALVTALPSGSQVVISTREGPPQAVRRLRSTGRTLELGPSELTLTTGESDLLLDELGVHLPVEQRRRVAEVTEGWPVGVYLLGRAILSSPDLVVDAPPSAWAPSWIADYIRDELFGELAPDDADFLLDVSVLDELSGPVCDAVSGTAGSQARLRTLAAHNQLIGHLEGGGDTFRLHQMYSDFLRKELRARSTERYHAAHRAAAEWFAAAGETELAVMHARECADDAFLGELVWANTGLLLSSGKLTLARRFLDGLPDERLRADCGLALATVWVSAHEADAERLMSFAKTVENLLEQDDAPSRYTYDADILRLFLGLGGLDGMMASATRAIDGLPRDEPWLTVAYYLRATAEQLLGQHDRAAADLVACRDLSERIPIPHLLAFALAAQARLALQSGDLKDAEELADRAAETLYSNQLQYMPSGAVIHTNLAGVHLAAGRRNEARAETEHALRLTALIAPSIPWFAVQGRLLLAQLFVKLGDPRQAKVLLDDVHELDWSAYASPVLDELLSETELMVRVHRATDHRARLTTAELRVLQYLPTHLTFPEIAATLYLSRHTVKTQAISIYRKLGVSSRGAAVDVARQQGLLPDVDRAGA